MILLVADNPAERALTERALETSLIACQLVVTKDSEEALAFLTCAAARERCSYTVLPALVLLCLKLKTSLDLLGHIRADARLKQLPVVFLATFDDDENIPGANDPGVNSYIRKPVDAEQFAEVIKAISVYWLQVNEPPSSQISRTSGMVRSTSLPCGPCARRRTLQGIGQVPE